MRIMSVDRVDASWGVIDSNDFNLFTRCFRKLFRKERIHLLGMRCRGKSEGKDKYREDELLQIAEHMRRRRKAVQEQNGGSIPGAGFAIEDFQPLQVKRAIENGRRNRVGHLNSP